MYHKYLIFNAWVVKRHGKREGLPTKMLNRKEGVANGGMVTSESEQRAIKTSGLRKILLIDS